jgi:xanthine/uracil permease
MRVIRRFLSPLLVGIVIMMVGLGLWPVLNNFIGAGWHIAIAVFVVAVVASFALGKVARTMAVFITVVLWYAVASVGTWQGWFPQGSALHVDFSAIGGAPWFEVTRPFAWGMPKFHVAFALAMLLPFIATMLEITGDFFAVARATEVPLPSVKRIGRGIGTEGVGTLISGVLGGTAVSTFSQNIGLLRLSGVGSRFVCVVAGGVLVVLGLVGKLGAVLGSIPEVIVGAVYLLVFGMLIMTGLHLVMRADLKRPRNEILVGTSLLLGLALPAYMSENPLDIRGSPTAEIFANVFLATPMMVAGIWAALLDNLLPGTPEERGISGQWA